MRVLFVHNSLRTFVRIDRDILAEKYDLVEIDFAWRADIVRQTLQEVARCDVVFGWFASHHTFMPTLLGKLRGKKVIICASDYDIANEPQANYGSMRGGIRKWNNNRIFQLADLVLVPSQFSSNLALTNTVLKYKPAKVQIVPHGIEVKDYDPVPKQPLVVTVGSGSSEETIWRKGLGTFVEMGRYLPDVKCGLIGTVGEEYQKRLKATASDNVTLHGFLSDDERDLLLSTAGAYAQLSYMEGFGLSVAEAMAAHCVPVVTENGALPEVVGECGIYVPYNDPEGAAQGVKEALARPELGKLARERVLDLFTLERRRTMLLEIMENL